MTSRPGKGRYSSDAPGRESARDAPRHERARDTDQAVTECVRRFGEGSAAVASILEAEHLPDAREADAHALARAWRATLESASWVIRRGPVSS